LRPSRQGRRNPRYQRPGAAKKRPARGEPFEKIDLFCKSSFGWFPRALWLVSKSALTGTAFGDSQTWTRALDFS
jgi:hypothetical protein